MCFNTDVMFYGEIQYENVSKHLEKVNNQNFSVRFGAVFSEV